MRAHTLESTHGLRKILLTILVLQIFFVRDLNHVNEILRKILCMCEQCVDQAWDPGERGYGIPNMNTRTHELRLPVLLNAWRLHWISHHDTVSDRPKLLKVFPHPIWERSARETGVNLVRKTAFF